MGEVGRTRIRKRRRETRQSDNCSALSRAILTVTRLMANLPNSATTASFISSSSSLSARSESDQQMRSAAGLTRSLSNASSQLSRTTAAPSTASTTVPATIGGGKVERSCAESEQQQEPSGPLKKVYTSKKIIEKAFHVLDELRKGGSLCDVTIRVGSQDFSVHRVVLAATSPYFLAMFTG